MRVRRGPTSLIPNSPALRPRPERGRRASSWGARATAVVGIFNGFSPVAGVGGVFAVDAVGTLRWVRVPNSPAGPGSALGWGGGLRVGILRESFALPGLTLSAVHERAGALRYGTDEGARRVG